MIRKPTQPHLPIAPKKRQLGEVSEPENVKTKKSAEESAGQPLKVKLPFDRKLSKEILIKCSKNDVGDTSKKKHNCN